MKKTIIVLLFFLISCTPSDDNIENNNEIINDNLYETVTLGNQTWAIENVDIESYSDGTPIPEVTDYDEWINLKTGAWCYMNNDSRRTKIYNWYAIKGIHDEDSSTPNKSFAPKGWKVPTKNDWEILIEHVENGEYSGSTSQSLSNDNWSKSGRHQTGTPGYTGVGDTENNSTGFNAHSVGWRISTQTTTNGTGFIQSGFDVFYWTINDFVENGYHMAWTAYLTYNTRQPRVNSRFVTDGVSIRFIKE